jgi:F-type H+-transporting ATPase subunit delta
MIEIRLGDRYAKSILGLAQEMNLVAETRNDFALIQDVCEQNRDFVNMLKSPLIHSSKKQAIIDEVFKGKLSKITQNFIQVVIRHGREKYLRDIAIRFLQQYDNLKNITRGVITSAAPLTDDQRSKVQKLVAKENHSEFVLSEEIDAELIGGFTLRVGDFLFDGSLASRLHELNQEFDNNPYVKQI